MCNILLHLVVYITVQAYIISPCLQIQDTSYSESMKNDNKLKELTRHKPTYQVHKSDHESLVIMLGATEGLLGWRGF